MNIYKYEMRAQRNSFLIWTVGLVLAMVLFMKGIYPIFQKSLDDLLLIMQGFPKGFMKALGLEIEDLLSYEGFYNFVYEYIALVGVIMSSAIALSVLGREKRLKCMDYLFSKPASREKIFFVKVFTCLTIITITNVIYLLSAETLYFLNDQSAEGLGKFIFASLGLYFTQLVFLSIGIFIAVFLKKIRSVSGAATSIGMVSFLLLALANLLEKDILYLFVPLKYFEPGSVINGNGFEGKYILASIVVIALTNTAAFFKYCKSDIHAV